MIKMALKHPFNLYILSVWTQTASCVLYVCEIKQKNQTNKNAEICYQKQQQICMDFTRGRETLRKKT